MKSIVKIITIIVFLCSIFNTKINAGWSVSTIAENIYQLRNITFVNKTTGYIVGGGYDMAGVIYKTTNSGKNWNLIHTTPGRIFLNVFFLNTNTGYVCGQYANILKTTNGGVNWEVKNAGNFDLNDIHFPSENTGYAAGLSGKIWKSTNNGNNWTLIQELGNIYLYSVFMIDNYFGFAGEYRTFNGINFSPFPPVEISNPVYETQFFDNSTGFMARNNIMKTTNAGVNWTEQNLQSNNKDLHFINLNTGFVLKGAYPTYSIAKTTNSGLNWNLNTLPKNGYSYSMYFINKDTGFVTCDSGKILSVFDGVIKVKIEQTIINDYELLNNFPNPFNSQTKIIFSVAKSSNVEIMVYDIQGRKIESLVNEYLFAGKYSLLWNPKTYGSGIYYIVLKSDKNFETQKVTLIK